MIQNRLDGGSAVAVSSGTAALHTALLVMGVGSGDEVVVPAMTFVATANAVTYCGAKPVFVDVSPLSWGLDPFKVEEFIEQRCDIQKGKLINRTTGRRVRGIIPVHLLGHPVDMDPILQLARRYGLFVVEDACESLGGLYKGRPIGRLADIGCFSFNGNKVITTGGGGLIITDNRQRAARARHLTTQAKKHPEEYIHDQVGYNYRLSNIAAALGCSQVELLDEFLNEKRRIAKYYRQAFAGISDLECMPNAAWASPTHWLFTICLKRRGGASRLVPFLRQRGIEARRLWKPLFRLPFHRDCEAFKIDFTNTLYDQAVSLPSFVGLSLSHQIKIVKAVLSFL